MKKYAWIAFAVILATIAGALWWNISNPTWAYGFVAAAVAALVQSLRPHLKDLFKPMDPEELKLMRYWELRGYKWNRRKKRPEPRN